MRTLKYILTILTLFQSFDGVSQSKKETENWIISKFNKWKLDFENPLFDKDKYPDMRSYEEPLKLSLDNCQLTLVTNNILQTALINKKTKIYRLNIGDIERVEWRGQFNLFIWTRKNSVAIIDYNQKNKTFYSNWIGISLNTNSEDDLNIRIEKAFNHLKSFCNPTSTPKEVF